MDLVSLRTFQTVVDEGGILAASKKLNTVQSNVTSRIKKLEEELGTELFYRQGRGLQLAPPGRVLIDYARKLLQLEAQATSAVKQSGSHSGELRIGAMENFAALRLAPVLKSVQQLHEGVNLHIETDTSSALVEQVLHHKLDCAFVGGGVDHPDLVTEEIRMEELVLVRSKESNESELPLILFHEGCAYRARALSWQRACGNQISKVMELGTLDGILGCVAIGLGCTLMLESVVKNSRHTEDLLIEPIDPNFSQIPTVLVRHRLTKPMKAMATLAEAAKSIQ